MRRASGGRASHRGGQVAPGCRTRELRLEDNQAGIELFLVHYDNGSAAYRRNFSWYGRVAYTYESRHTNYMHHLAHALVGRPHVAAAVRARYSHLLLPDEDILLAPAAEVRAFVEVAHRMRAAITQPLVVKTGAADGEVAALSYDQLKRRVDYARLQPACEVARQTDWVEVMTPLVTTCTLFDLIARYHNDAAVTDYGLDPVWCQAAPHVPSAPPLHLRGPACAIIDSVVFVHGDGHTQAYKSHQGIYTEQRAKADQICARRHFGRFWSSFRTFGCASANGTLMRSTEGERRNFTSPPRFPRLLPPTNDS